MKKDFSTIREMANKKLLNGEQKKNLHKLFESKINIAIQATKEKHNKQNKEDRENYKARTIKLAPVKNAIKNIDKADEALEKNYAVLEKYSIEYDKDYHDKHRKISIVNSPKELSDLYDKRINKIVKMEDLKLELLANLHGLPMTYAEMTEYIDNEIAKL